MLLIHKKSTGLKPMPAYTLKTAHENLILQHLFEPIPRTSLRPISNSQLHTLLHFHLCPIYLILSKGSWDISSRGGLHA